MQISFDPLKFLDDGSALTMAAARKVAQLRRNEVARNYTKQGYPVTRFNLTNQLQKYAGFGKPDGRSRTVYYVDVRTHAYEPALGE